MLARPEPIDRIETALADGTFARDPHRWYDRLRQAAPVYWSPYLEQWLVTSCELVERILLSPGNFSNFGFNRDFIRRLPAGAYEDVRTLRHHYNQHGLIQTDPPEHTRMRRLLGPSFSPKAVSHLGPVISDRVSTLIDKARRRHEPLNVVTRLAKPIPVDVIADLLGVPEPERENFPAWSAQVVRFFGTPTPMPAHARTLDRSLVEWRSLILDLLKARSQQPACDFVTELARLVDSGQIETEEALFTAIHLLIAGHETTTALIANTVYCLLGHLDELDRVRSSPHLLGNAVEETLRFEPSITRLRRLTVNDTDLGGTVITRGDPVSAVISSANRDPNRFAEPHEFSVNRKFQSAPHLSFGKGRHFCLGANLARIEASIAVTGFLENFPGARLSSSHPTDRVASINHRSLASLLVTHRDPRVRQMR